MCFGCVSGCAVWRASEVREVCGWGRGDGNCCCSMRLTSYVNICNFRTVKAKKVVEDDDDDWGDDW